MIFLEQEQEDLNVKPNEMLEQEMNWLDSVITSPGLSAGIMLI